MYHFWFTLLTAAVALLIVGGPVLLAVLLDRRRRLRADRVARQIALTEALDARLGPIVAPVVRTRPWGAWQVEVAGEFPPAILARVFAIAQQTFAGFDAPQDRAFRLVLDAPSPRRASARVRVPERRFAA